MKTGSILLILGLTTSCNLHAQVISRFLWSSTPLTGSANGPSGTSISSSATTSYIGGSLGYALNPGVPTQNVNLIVPGSPYFDVPSIYIDLYFRREENQASFFRRGALFDFGMNGGNLYVTFTTTQGSTPGNLTVTASNIVAVADDHVFHRYRFGYDNNTGTARIWVDNTVVYTYNGVAGRPLAWTGGGDLIIGEQMDASGRNIGVLSNFSVQLYSESVLTEHLLNFNAIAVQNEVSLQWDVIDGNIVEFIVERATNGINFIPVLSVRPPSSTRPTGNYNVSDYNIPTAGEYYYRLKLIDADGGSSYSKSIRLSLQRSRYTIRCFPNPASSVLKVDVHSPINAPYQYEIFNHEGVPCSSGILEVRAGSNELSIPLQGIHAKGKLFLRIRCTSNSEVLHTSFIKL